MTFFIAGSAAASEQDTDVYRLGEVVVGPDGGGVEAAGTVMTVTARDIKDRGARTLDDALKLLPGVSIRTGGEGSPRIDIRGFRTRHVLLLLDGTPFNGTFDGQFDPSFIPVENIAEIRVTTGGSSVLYGQGGNGGVINIITKKGRKGLHAYVSGEGAEADAYMGKAALSGGTQAVDFYVSGGARSQRGFRLSDQFIPTAAENGGIRENSHSERYNAFANMGWSPSGSTTVGVTFNYLAGEFGKPPVTNFSAADPFTSKTKFDRTDDEKGYTAQVAISHDFQGPVSMKGWAYFNRLGVLDNSYDNATYTTQNLNGASREDSRTDITGVNLQTSYDMAGYGRATLAVMFEDDSWESAGFSVGAGNVKTPFAQGREFQVYTVAAEYEAEPVKGMGVVLGYGHHFQERADAGSDNDFSYLAGAHYDFSTGTRIKASHERKVRFPSIKQLYEAAGGNPSLKAERSTHYEAGVEQQLPANTTVSVTGFMTDAREFIEKDALKVNRNFEKSRFTGVEVVAENRAVENLLLRASWSYLHTKDRSAGSNRDQLQYRPGTKLAAECMYRSWFGLTAYASVLFVGNQYYYNKNVAGKRRLGGYAVVDMKISQPLMADRLSMYLGVNNLLDRNYEQSYGLPQPGRTVYGGVEFRI